MAQLLDGTVMQMFRLTNEPGGLGLSCTPSGLSLAGVPLLRRTHAGFALRPASEIAALLKAAYDDDQIQLRSSLGTIAHALNSGDFARAMIAAVHTRTPELRREAAIRLANAEQELTKYNPDEPRDWHGHKLYQESAADLWSSCTLCRRGVDYEPRTTSDLDPALIESKTIQLAIPEYTSPTQWRYLNRAIIYGKENGVKVVITRIRE